MRLLLTNDDGIEAPGLSALVRAVQGLGEIAVIAPATVRSAASHSVTFHKAMPVGKRMITDADGQTLFDGLAVEGNPADCVKLAITNLLPQPVDVVLSGINAGANVGVNVIYSGTVAAAREAAIYSLPAIALSLHIGKREKIRWERASQITHDLLLKILAGPLTPGVLLSVNIPILDDGREPLGVRVAPVSTSPLDDAYDCFDGPDGRKHYQASAGFAFRRRQNESDVEALFAGYVSITPLIIDPTDTAGLAVWADRLA